MSIPRTRFSSNNNNSSSRNNSLSDTTLYAKNLPYRCDSQEFSKFLKTMTQVPPVRVHVTNKGFGFVSFTASPEATRALKDLSNPSCVFNGRQISFEFAKKGEPSSPSLTPSGKIKFNPSSNSASNFMDATSVYKDGPFVDVGANLTSKSFKNDLSQILRSSRENGVQSIVITVRR